MNYYAEAIEVLTKEQDWKSVVIQIAKSHPKAVVVAIADINNDWRIEARKLFLEQGEKIKAIKHCRNVTGMGLKEAKEAVEALEV